MSLRAKLHGLIVALMLVLMICLTALFVGSMRRTVNEEVVAASRITQQLLSRLISSGERGGLAEMRAFLDELGRVRASNLTLIAADGGVLYRSPPPTYKAGRDAPEWFARLVRPTVPTQQLSIDGGRLVIEPESSRAILDGWDTMRLLLAIGVALFVMINALVHGILGRSLSPFERIVASLRQMEAGAFHTRLPELPGREAAEMGAAFNRMAAAVEDSVEASASAAESKARLAVQRELTQSLHQRIEAERRSLARELHDELGQQVTAIKSIAYVLAQRAEPGDSALRTATRALVDCSDQLYDSMHAMIPRLRPLALDDLGLAAAVADLVDDWRQRAVSIRFELGANDVPDALSDAVKIAAYRIVQEAISNAIRHGQPGNVAVTLQQRDDALLISVSDDGRGLPDDAMATPQFGLRGMRERAEALGGDMRIGARDGGGTLLQARLPIGDATHDTEAATP